MRHYAALKLHTKRKPTVASLSAKRLDAVHNAIRVLSPDAYDLGVGWWAREWCYALYGVTTGEEEG